MACKSLSLVSNYANQMTIIVKILQLCLSVSFHFLKETKLKVKMHFFFLLH